MCDVKSSTLAVMLSSQQKNVDIEFEMKVHTKKKDNLLHVANVYSARSRLHLKRFFRVQKHQIILLSPNVSHAPTKIMEKFLPIPITKIYIFNSDNFTNKYSKHKVS